MGSSRHERRAVLAACLIRPTRCTDASPERGTRGTGTHTQRPYDDADEPCGQHRGRHTRLPPWFRRAAPVAHARTAGEATIRTTAATLPRICRVGVALAGSSGVLEGSAVVPASGA